jgi:hypothetical protein
MSAFFRKSISKRIEKFRSFIRCIFRKFAKTRSTTTTTSTATLWHELTSSHGHVLYRL